MDSPVNSFGEKQSFLVSLTLPFASGKAANYAPWVRTFRLLFPVLENRNYAIMNAPGVAEYPQQMNPRAVTNPYWQAYDGLTLLPQVRSAYPNTDAGIDNSQLLPDMIGPQHGLLSVLQKRNKQANQSNSNG